MSIHSCAALGAGSCTDLTQGELMEIQGGLTLWTWSLGIYLAKQVGDNWDDFKQGVVEGFNAVAG